MAREQNIEKYRIIPSEGISPPAKGEVLALFNKDGSPYFSSESTVFEVRDLHIPAGTDFVDPLEVGKFSLSWQQKIVSAMMSISYLNDENGQSISMYVAPVDRPDKAPTLDPSGYLFLGNNNAGNFTPALSPASGSFGSFSFWGQDITLFNDTSERDVLTPFGEEVELDFGVYLSVLSDSTLFPEFGASYGDVTIKHARLSLIII